MDDEGVVREILKALLKSLGYSVVCKKNGNEAVDYFTAEVEANRKLSGHDLRSYRPRCIVRQRSYCLYTKAGCECPGFCGKRV